jgi:predicted kinase
MTTRPVLHLLCGKAASGKSTLARRLAEAPSTVLISEDDWLSRLYKDQQKTIADYIRNSRRLREVMGPHVEALLKAGLSIVLDFPANTPSVRGWMRGLAEAAGVEHRLYFLDASDEVCKARLRRRNEDGSHEFAVSDAEYDEITRYFVPPSDSEGLHLVRATQNITP